MIEYTDDEKEAIMKTEEFQRFFDRTTRIIERALEEGPDIFTDYSGIDSEDQERYVLCYKDIISSSIYLHVCRSVRCTSFGILTFKSKHIFLINIFL